ncbi:class I ribonucleotide reductase maintenance protein YfaE [Enterobacteriaceae bacterium ESL0689]|nr:class I ribonucleotide reductase maintenance protein YfaE [Enterobacteriaceae bacterium ESL0689]
MKRIFLQNSAVCILCTAEHPSLLATLEAHHVAVEYQCRAGYCGACRTRLLAGQVKWLAEPLAFVQPGEILPCCCQASGDIVIGM